MDRTRRSAAIHAGTSPAHQSRRVDAGVPSSIRKACGSTPSLATRSSKKLSSSKGRWRRHSPRRQSARPASKPGVGSGDPCRLHSASRSWKVRAAYHSASGRSVSPVMDVPVEIGFSARRAWADLSIRRGPARTAAGQRVRRGAAELARRPAVPREPAFPASLGTARRSSQQPGNAEDVRAVADLLPEKRPASILNTRERTDKALTTNKLLRAVLIHENRIRHKGIDSGDPPVILPGPSRLTRPVPLTTPESRTAARPGRLADLAPTERRARSPVPNRV